jgi:hypothetical protein
MTLRPLSYLHSALLPSLVILMRLFWLWPWVLVLSRWLTVAAEPLLPAWLVAALFAAGALLRRFAVARASSVTVARRWVGGISFVLLVGLLWWRFYMGDHPLWDPAWLARLARDSSDWRVEFPAPVLLLLIAGGVWLRGIMDGGRNLNRDHVWSALTTGAIALAVLALLVRLDPRGIPPATAQWVTGFFTAGLTALALSSLALAQSRSTLGDQAPPALRLNRHWLLSVSLVIAGVVGLVLALTALVTPSGLAETLGWLAIPARWIIYAVGIVILSLAYLTFLLLTPLINWLVQRAAEAPPREPVPPSEFLQQLQQFLQETETVLPSTVATSLRWLWITGLVACVLLIIMWAVRALQRREQGETDERRDFIFTRALFQDQLAALWRAWLARLQSLSPSPASPYLDLAGEHPNRRAIRALYQLLLASTASLGISRSHGQTPREYQAQLESALMLEAASLEMLTDGYEDARYGQSAPTGADVEAARAAWSRLEPQIAAGDSLENWPQNAGRAESTAENDTAKPTDPTHASKEESP